MRRFWILFCVFAAVILAAEVSGRRIKGRKYLPFSETFDADDRRSPNVPEENARKELESRSRLKSFMSDFSITCDFSNWTTPSCCAGMSIFNSPHNICIDIQLNLKRLSIYAALSVDFKPLIEAEFLLSKICLRFPPFPKLSACGHVYYFDCNFGSPLFIQTCLTVTVADLLELRFYCIKYENGDLSRVDDVEPEETAPFAVLFKKDKVVFEFNAAIPELLLQLLGSAVQFITDSIIFIATTIASAVKGFIDTVTDFFRPKPRLT